MKHWNEGGYSHVIFHRQNVCKISNWLQTRIHCFKDTDILPVQVEVKSSFFCRKNSFDGQILFKDSPKALLVFAFSFLRALFTATLRLCPRQFNHGQPRSPPQHRQCWPRCLEWHMTSFTSWSPMLVRTPSAFWLAPRLCGHQEHVPLRVTSLAVSNLQLHSEKWYSCRWPYWQLTTYPQLAQRSLWPPALKLLLPGHHCTGLVWRFTKIS